LDGRYGKKGHQKQRYKCLPINGEKRHVFTETLPRLHGGSGECLECERDYASHEGPPTGRRFDFSTRDVSFALMEIGKGETDRGTGWRVRQRAGRLLLGTRNKDGNTVADWVELFAPPIFETLRATAWPKVIALDAQPMHVRRKKDGQPVQGGKLAFNVLGALGWETRLDEGNVLALEAAPNFGLNQGKHEWVSFLERLDDQLTGHPVSFICDEDQTIKAAIEQVFGSGPGAPMIFSCHWHLVHNLEARLTEAGVAFDDPIRWYIAHDKNREATCTCARCSPESWHDFDQQARAIKNKPLTAWLDKHGAKIPVQLALRDDFTGGRTAIGPLEQKLTWIERKFEDRRGMFHNRERMNRRLMLMQLELNRQASMHHYAKVIRDELMGNGGYGAERHLLDDQLGSSLRTY
jgi:hypothetical protein